MHYWVVRTYGTKYGEKGINLLVNTLDHDEAVARCLQLQHLFGTRYTFDIIVQED